MTLLRRAALFALVVGCSEMGLPAMAADKSKAGDEAGRFYFPNLEQGDSRTVQPGEEVVRRPVVWANSALIGQDVRIDSTQGMLTIKANTVLPAVQISNLPGEMGDIVAYCTVAPKLKPKMVRGMFGVLGAKLIESLSDGRKCLFDKDEDGSADTAFLVNDGDPADRRPQSIHPVSLNIAENREAGPGDYVVIKLRKSSAPSFQIEIFENGEEVAFDAIVGGDEVENRIQKFSKDAIYPVGADVYGACFSVLTHEKKSGAITVQWSGKNRDAKISVPTKVVYHYVYY